MNKLALTLLILVSTACGTTTDPVALLGPDAQASTTEKAERYIPPSTSSTTTTRPLSTEELLAQAVCDDVTRLLDENPDLRVATVLSYGDSLRTELQSVGADLSAIGAIVAATCDNGYDNEAILGYAGFGPLADRVSYTLDRGTCGPRGDYGGVLGISGTGTALEAELVLTYVANGIVEHETTEYIEVTPGGNKVAFEFYLPEIPAGGTCDVLLRSVRQP